GWPEGLDHTPFSICQVTCVTHAASVMVTPGEGCPSHSISPYFLQNTKNLIAALHSTPSHSYTDTKVFLDIRGGKRRMRRCDIRYFCVAISAGCQFVIQKLPPVSEDRRQAGIMRSRFGIRKIDHFVAELVQFVDCRLRNRQIIGWCIKWWDKISEVRGLIDSDIIAGGSAGSKNQRFCCFLFTTMRLEQNSHCKSLLGLFLRSPIPQHAMEI